MSTVKNSIVFVIPVRNPDDKKVQDYGTIELLLKQTIFSLMRQNNAVVHIIVVCHVTPKYASLLPENITFLNVGGIPVFSKRKNQVRVDKGLKYIIGALYAAQYIRHDFIMPMDADDYIHTGLTDYIAKYNNDGNKVADGYIVRRGIHVLLDVIQGSEIRYQQAYLVQNFNVTCGSCRIFDSSRLMDSISSECPGYEKQFLSWPQRDKDRCVDVPTEPVQWLDTITREQYNSETSLVNALGRHMNQRLNFRLIPIDFVGAAKGCGHGNHDGPRRGDIHEDKVIGIYNNQQFLVEFGLTGIADLSKNAVKFSVILSLPRYYIINRLRYLVSHVKERLAGKILV